MHCVLLRCFAGIHFASKQIMLPTHRLVLGKNMSIWNASICLGLNLASNVCVYVPGVGVCMCFAKEPKWCHFLPVINWGLCRQFSAQSHSYLQLSILSLSLSSLGRVRNALSSKVHFTFRQFALFCVIVLLEWVCFLPKKTSSRESQSPIVSEFGLGVMGSKLDSSYLVWTSF